MIRRLAAVVVATLGATAVASVVGVAPVGATPWLNYLRTIQTNPFTGTSTKMGDNEGMAYVAANDAIWAVDDSKGQIYSVNRVTGVLGQTITRSEFIAAPAFVGGVAGQHERTLDMESIAYDSASDTMYLFNGKCCTSATLPTAYRLTRPDTSSPFTVESWQPLSGDYNDMSGAAVRGASGEIWTAQIKSLVQYTYETNTFGTPVVVDGMSSIFGVSFNPDGTDMWLVGSNARLIKYAWVTPPAIPTAVPGFTFNAMYAFGTNDTRAVEVIGSELYISDGYDYYSAGDPNAFGIRVYELIDTTITAPVASFTKNKSGGLSPQSVAFTDTSTNIPTSWLWNFGDGSTSTIRNPSKTFSTPGVYNVTLTATNPGGATVTAPQVVTITGASFSTNVTQGTAPITVAFTDTSTNAPTSWLWNFGDGTTSTAQNPSKTYSTPGVYDVTLTATGAVGSHTTAPKVITASSPMAPVAAFTPSVTTGTAPMSVTFTDTSTNVPTAWSWSWGDGSPDTTTQNPAHTFTTPGTYSVTLTASNAAGSHTSPTQTVTVIPVGSPVTTTFTPTDDAYVDISLPGTPRPTTTALYNAQTATNTERSYIKFDVAGLLGPVTSATLRLWVTDGTDNGAAWYRISDNTWSQSTLTWNNAPPVAGQTLVGDPGAVAVSTWLEVDVTSAVTTDGTVSFATLATSINRERYSSKEGTSPPELVVTVQAGGPPPPVASFTESTPTGTSPLTVNFTDSSSNTPTSWLWSFGDGTSSTLQHPSHVFESPGSYDVTLVATNAGGTDTAVAHTITVSPPAMAPVAAFTKSSASGPAPLTVTFTDASSNTPTAWLWSWGDGTANSTTQNPNHTFTAPGAYDVTLTASNSSGSSTTPPQVVTVIVAGPPPVASFTSSAVSGITPLAVTLTDTSTNSPTSWLWSFGDGTTSTAQHPSKTYATAGVFSVTLTATNAGGSHTSSPQTIAVLGAPGPVRVAAFTSSVASGVAPLSVAFTDRSSVPPTAWMWSFGDGTTSALQNPTKVYSAPGLYTVTLAITYGAGATDTSFARTITVSGPAPKVTTFAAIDDTYADSVAPNTPRGSASQVYVKSPNQRAYLKFNVTGLSGAVTGAKLRLWVTDGTTDGAAWYRVGSNTWTEATLTWANAPSLSGATLMHDPAAVSVGTWLEIPVTSAVTGNGTYSFTTLPTSINAEKFSSAEGANPPQLVVTSG